MSFQNICAPAPVVSVVNNTVTALSTDVAKLFSKLHKDVLRSIRSLIEQAPSLNERNFALVEVKDAKGENRPAYRMDRKGFVLLAMGFTGEVALKFKIAYIDAFDTMERKLYQGNVTSTDTITNAQQVAIQQAVARRAKKTAVYYQTIYRAIKARYQIPRYTELKQSQFEDCMRFIETVDLSVPEVPASEPTETEKPQRYVVYADFLKTLQVFCYYQRYLFRKPLMQAMRVMQALDVPDASKLWDVVNNLNFVELERSLDDLGFSVKDLDCYKHWALTHTAQ
ncbi:Rha family transcriptional regulator [Parasutterella excrementihominis]|uniref:Rha family transcriptional regulator n=1 Tax=Parasutterella excrementihominis TaxID=487175 RepID=UPI0035651F59